MRAKLAQKTKATKRLKHVNKQVYQETTHKPKVVKGLTHANKQIHQKRMNEASKDLALTLIECGTDIIKGRASLTTHQAKQLRPYEDMLRHFVFRLNAKLLF